MSSCPVLLRDGIVLSIVWTLMNESSTSQFLYHIQYWTWYDTVHCMLPGICESLNRIVFHLVQPRFNRAWRFSWVVQRSENGQNWSFQHTLLVICIINANTSENWYGRNWEPGGRIDRSKNKKKIVIVPKTKGMLRATKKVRMVVLTPCMSLFTWLWFENLVLSSFDDGIFVRVTECLLLLLRYKYC